MQKPRLFIIIIILTFVLVACGGSEDSDDNTTAPLEQQSQTERENTSQLNDGVEVQAQEAPIDVLSEEDAVDESFASSTSVAMAAPQSTQALQTGAVAGGEAGYGGVLADQNAIPPTPDAMTFDNPGTNPFFDTEDDHLSTFAMDVDTGSYTVARNYLTAYNQLPPEDSVRPEEFINYFDAEYDSPEEDAFAIYLDAAPAPFGYEGHYLMRVGLQGRYVAPEDRDPVFLIFVIDVSGSMDQENRLGTVKESLALLTGELGENDRVGIVVYSDRSRAVLEPTPASDRETIMAAINALQPEGSTNVEDGLRVGYRMAESNMREGENVRVIVLSDGVANVGNTGPDSILNTIHEGVDAGINLSTIGFGMGNYNDALMEQLANDGNGNYYYVDNMREATRVFVHNLTSTLQVIGYDARVQVDFNPDVTDRYRLIGYENRDIADEDFRNDEVDAGEVGAGHSITALYELALEDGIEMDSDAVVATVYIRYEDAETREVVELNQSLTVADIMDSMDDAPASFRLQAAVAEFSEQLRGSVWAEGHTLGDVMTLAMPLREELPDNVQVEEFAELLQLAAQYQDR